jgi:hypothetical protein
MPGGSRQGRRIDSKYIYMNSATQRHLFQKAFWARGAGSIWGQRKIKWEVKNAPVDGVQGVGLFTGLRRRPEALDLPLNEFSAWTGYILGYGDLGGDLGGSYPWK